VPVERRTILKSAALAPLAGPFAGLVVEPAAGRRAPSAAALVPVKDKRDGVVRLHLPRGFNYRSFHDTEVPVVLDDDTVLPGRHDGMGAFAGPDDTVVLVRNHEVNGPVPKFGPGAAYDPMAGGGTTTIQTTRQGKVLNSFTSLNGTMMNCSGGIMPWGSWVTCEETINGPDVGPDFTGASNVPLTKPHGYVFEVPASHDQEDGQSSRQPITQAGRFAHEAVSFDPVHNHLYLTEDNFGFPSGFYRYRPPSTATEVGRIEDGGILQMLKVRGVDNAHLEAHQTDGSVYEIDWVDIAEPDPTFFYTPGETAPTSNNDAIIAVGQQGYDQGAAYFSRLEGQVYSDGVVYFTSTQGGGPAEASFGPIGNGFGNGSGQVWAYDTATEELRLVFQSSGPLELDLPDNITVSPTGTLVVCEDSSGDNFLRGLSTDGQIWDVALNRLRGMAGGDRSGDEFAGSTFSPGGHTLFVNIQASNGMSFAIWGPWRSVGV